MRKTPFNKKIQNAIDKLSVEQIVVFLFAIILGFFALALKKIVLFLIIIFSAAILLGIMFSPKIKGMLGENRIRKVLKRCYKKNQGYLINDVIVPGENGRTSQIDHILINEYGVFVVETKNYAGRIYGNDSQREWTQVLKYGAFKNKFYNPVMQNATHVSRIKELIPTAHVYSIVLFNYNNISYIESNYVKRTYEVKKFIRKQEKVLEIDVIQEIFSIINEYKINPIQTNKEHIQEIKEMQQNIANNICPRCGKLLVLRKSNNSSFYGCSGFPKCKFTKKI